MNSNFFQKNFFFFIQAFTYKKNHPNKNENFVYNENSLKQLIIFNFYLKNYSKQK